MNRFADNPLKTRGDMVRLAVDLISASWRSVWLDQGTAEEVSALIGNNSYLSGLPTDDPRNHNVKSLLPSSSAKQK